MQISLGVIFKNENKLAEMVEILAHIHQYVQQLEFDEECAISRTNEVVTVYT